MWTFPYKTLSPLLYVIFIYTPLESEDLGRSGDLFWIHKCKEYRQNWNMSLHSINTWVQCWCSVFMENKKSWIYHGALRIIYLKGGFWGQGGYIKMIRIWHGVESFKRNLSIFPCHSYLAMRVLLNPPSAVGIVPTGWEQTRNSTRYHGTPAQIVLWTMALKAGHILAPYLPLYKYSFCGLTHYDFYVIGPDPSKALVNFRSSTATDDNHFTTKATCDEII